VGEGFIGHYKNVPLVCGEVAIFLRGKVISHALKVVCRGSGMRLEMKNSF
jgi:hypothetical protein